MGTLWTMVVPVIVIMVMRKAFKMLGLGDLLNPVSALGLATGGAGKMMKDGGATLSLGKGIANGAKNAGLGAYDKTSKANKWAKSDTFSRNMVRAGSGALGRRMGNGARGIGQGFSQVAQLRRKEKRAELSEKLRNSIRDTQAAAGGRLTAAWAQAGIDLNAGRAHGSNQVTGWARGASNVLGARWRDGAAGRGDLLTAGQHMLARVAAAGVELSGEGSPELGQAFAAWGRKLDPAAPEMISRQYDRELRTRLARVYDEDEAGRVSAALGAERQEVLARTMLGRDFNTAGSLSAASINALAASYADAHHVPRSNVLVDPTTGFTTLMVAGQNRIPATDDPAVLEAYARNPLTWLSPEVTARNDGEGDAEYAFRMRATLDRAGLLDPHTGAVVDMLDKLELEPGPDLTDQLKALSAGRKTELRDYIGVADPSDQALHDVKMAVKHNFRDVDSAASKAAVVVELKRELGEVKVSTAEVDTDIATALSLSNAIGSAVTRAASPLELRASVDKFSDDLTATVRDVFGKLADQTVSVYSVQATAGASPSEVTALVGDLDRFQDEMTDQMRGLLDQLGDRLHLLRTTQSPADADRMARELTGWLEGLTGNLRGSLDQELDSAMRKLADVATRDAQMAAMSGNGVSRPGDYANGSEPPRLRMVS